MAYTALTLQSPNKAGTALAFTAPSGTGSGEGWKLPGNTGQQTLLVNNGSGSSLTVTIKIAKTVDGMTVASKTVTVAAGAMVPIGPFNSGDYNQTSDSMVHVEVSSATSITAAWIKSF